jgi:P27 family predicted phage terminase small subunit
MVRHGGKRPKPTHLKLVTGTFRKHRAPKNEPVPELAIPPVPTELGDDAKLEWGRVSVELFNLGLIANIDRAAFAAYCAAYGRWIAAERALNTPNSPMALLVKTQQGNVIQNPLIGISNKAAAAMVQFATEFGMTPSARAKVNGASGASKETDPAAKYLTT